MAIGGYLRIFFVLLAVMLFLTSTGFETALAAPPTDGTVDSTDRYARALDSNLGLLDFNPDNGNVAVTSSTFSGYAWSDYFGWINLAPTNGGVSYDAAGTVSGYAWGQGTGWVNFSPTNGGVTIDDNGYLHGHAWGENIGWIVFSCETDSTCGTLDHRVKVNGTSSGGGGTGGSGGGTLNDPPELTVIGGRPVYIQQGANFVDPGATAFDPEDGDISSLIVTQGTVNIFVPGTYQLTYTVEDSEGISRSITRTVIVTTQSRYAPYCGDGVVNQTWEQCDDSAQCLDTCLLPSNQCTDLTLARVVLTGVYNWSQGDVTTDISLGPTGNIIPSGVWFPVFHQGSALLDANIDNYTGSDIAIERSVAGIKLLMYGSHVTYVPQSHIDGYIEFYNSRPITQISDSRVDYRVENGFNGTGVGIYKAGDDELWTNNQNSHFWLTVSTQNDSYRTVFSPGICTVPTPTDEPPTITPNGPVPMTITVGTAFVDPGAYAFDREDGNITNRIVTSSGVNSAVVGTYEVTYRVTDSAGQSAQVTRVVYVVPAGAGSQECGLNLVQNGGFEIPGVPHESGWNIFAPAGQYAFKSQETLLRLAGNFVNKIFTPHVYAQGATEITSEHSGKVEFCHVPPGAPSKKHEVSVDSSATAALEKIGGYVGKCSSFEPKPEITAGTSPGNPLYELSTIIEGLVDLVVGIINDNKVEQAKDRALERLLELDEQMSADSTNQNHVQTAKEKLEKEIEKVAKHSDNENDVSDVITVVEIVLEDRKNESSNNGRREEVEELKEEIGSNVEEIVAEAKKQKQEDAQKKAEKDNKKKGLSQNDYKYDKVDFKWGVEWVSTTQTHKGSVRPADALLKFYRLAKWPSKEGMQHVALDSDWNGHQGSLNGEPASVRIFQDIPTIPGEKYELKFSFSAQPDTPKKQNIINAFWGDTQLTQVTLPGKISTEWHEYSFVVTASTNSTRISFSDGGPANSVGTFLDDVSVTQITSSGSAGQDSCLPTTQNTPPILTLIGETPIVLTVGDGFVDPGASAYDAEDGDITQDIVATGIVDTSTTGSTRITYNVEDSAGLPALPVERIVEVIPENISPPQCEDEIDNDNDGDTDVEDESCHTNGDEDDPTSYDSGDDSESDNDSGGDNEADETQETPQLIPGLIPPPILTTLQDIADEPAARTLLYLLPLLGLLGSAFSISRPIPRIPGGFSLLEGQWRLRSLLSLPGWRRRGLPWGTVYDSSSKKVLSFVDVDLYDSSGQFLKTEKTDEYGRYGFLVPAGQYQMRVRAAGYAFPSIRLGLKSRDALYENLYYGKKFEVKDSRPVITFDVPLDLTQQEGHAITHDNLYARHGIIFAYIFVFLFWAGFLVSLVYSLVVPDKFALIVTVVYIAAIVYAFSGKPQWYGKLIFASGYPASSFRVKVFGADENTSVKETESDKDGRYYALVPPHGKYYLEAIPPGEVEKVISYRTEPVKTRHGIIRETFILPEKNA